MQVKRFLNCIESAMSAGRAKRAFAVMIAILVTALMSPMTLAQQEDVDWDAAPWNGGCQIDTFIATKKSIADAGSYAFMNRAILPEPQTEEELVALSEKANGVIWSGFKVHRGSDNAYDFKTVQLGSTGENITSELDVATSGDARDSSHNELCVAIHPKGPKLWARKCTQRYGFILRCPRYIYLFNPCRYWPFYWPVWWYRHWKWCCHNNCCSNRQVTDCYLRNQVYLEGSLPAPVSNENECWRSCQSVSECKFYTWNEVQVRCYLHAYEPGSSFDSPTNRGGTKTLQIGASNFQFVGRAELIDNPSDCQAACQRDPKCHTFSWIPEGVLMDNNDTCIFNYGPAKEVFPIAPPTGPTIAISGPKFCDRDQMKRPKELPDFVVNFKEFIGQDFVESAL